MENKDKDLKEAYNWIYNNWDKFALFMAIVNMIGVIAGTIVSLWIPTLGVAIGSVWSLLAGMSTGMIWVSCGKPSQKKR